MHHDTYRPAEYAAYRQRTLQLEDALAAAEHDVRALKLRPDEITALEATIRRLTDTLTMCVRFMDGTGSVAGSAGGVGGAEEDSAGPNAAAACFVVSRMRDRPWAPLGTCRQRAATLAAQQLGADAAGLAACECVENALPNDDAVADVAGVDRRVARAGANAVAARLSPAPPRPLLYSRTATTSAHVDAA